MKNVTILICFLFIVVFNNNTYSQEESSTYNSKWQLKIAAGPNIPLTTMKQHRETDNFIEFSSKPQTVPSVSLTYFFSKKWGIEAHFKINYFNNKKEQSDNFQNYVKTQYQEDYYHNAFSPVSNIIEPLPSFGIVYREETDKLYFYPKISITVTSFYANWADIELKEIGTNNEYTVDYWSDRRAKDNFTIIPSVSTGYKFSDRFWLDLSIAVPFFRTNFSYDKKFTNLYTQQNTVEHIEYKESIFEMYVSLGLIYTLSKKK